jgi:hypothetical protein
MGNGHVTRGLCFRSVRSKDMGRKYTAICVVTSIEHGVTSIEHGVIQLELTLNMTSLQLELQLEHVVTSIEVPDENAFLA